MTTKRCSRCKKVKPLEEFSRNANHKDGYGCYCRLCAAEYAKEWRQKNPDYRTAKTRIVVEEKQCQRCKKVKPIEEFPKNKRNCDGRGSYCRSCWSKITAEWRKKNPEKWREIQREQMLKVKYNITPTNYDALLQSQNGVCAICGKSCPTGKRLAVDHDHETDKVRGLLCVNCNVALGYVQDDSDLLRKLADYLEKHNTGVQ